MAHYGLFTRRSVAVGSQRDGRDAAGHEPITELYLTQWADSYQGIREFARFGGQPGCRLTRGGQRTIPSREMDMDAVNENRHRRVFVFIAAMTDRCAMEFYGGAVLRIRKRSSSRSDPRV
jgi:hypothetical protein